jgi:hypothetical protein
VPLIEVDQQTDDYLALAARVAGISKGQVVAHLIALARSESAEMDAPSPSREPPGLRTVAIHADYDGHRTNATFVRGLGRIEIIDGPLAGRSFKTPSEAAKEIVTTYNPNVSANRNGWTFWVISEKNAPLQTIRYDDL